MHAEKVKDGIYWVGALNPDLRRFDVIMKTRWGTSYNSYLIKGSEKVALVDVVKEKYAEEHIAHISELVDPAKIDYIISNHTEPDHSGSLAKLLAVARNATVVCSKVAHGFLKNITNLDFTCMEVGDGDKLDLGGKTLEFLSVPFLHWPDSIFTYAREDKMLFSGDMFGFHFAAEKVFDDLTMLDDEMVKSQKYYFDVIMSPFKSYVLEAVEKLKNLSIEIIGPSHGPVLRGDPQGAVERYYEWAKDSLSENNPRKAYVGYVSCYGYTKKLAEKVYEGMIKNGLSAEIEDISLITPGEAAQKLQEADVFAIGTPTVNRDALKPIWDVASLLCSYVMKGKRCGVFGSFGWSGEGVKFIKERLSNLGVKVEDTLSVKFNPTEDDLQRAYELGELLSK